MHWPSVILYMSSSFMIVIFNKIVLTAFSFTSVPFIMLAQSVFTATVTFIRDCNTIQMPNLDIVLVCMFSTGNIFFGLSSAAALNIAMFTALRRISIFMTMVAQHYFFEEPIHNAVLWSVVIMILGSLIAAANDLSFSLEGYTYVMVNNILTVAAQIQTKKTLAKKWSKSSILFWTSVLTACISAMLLTHWDPTSFKAWNEPAFQFAFTCSVVLGFVINYAYAWTIEQNDALTLAVAGSTKSAIMGLMVTAGLFDRTYIFSWSNFSGLQISTLGSFMYVWFKNNHNVDTPQTSRSDHTEHKKLTRDTEPKADQV